MEKEEMRGDEREREREREDMFYRAGVNCSLSLFRKLLHRKWIQVDIAK